MTLPASHILLLESDYFRQTPKSANVEQTLKIRPKYKSADILTSNDDNYFVKKAGAEKGLGKFFGTQRLFLG